MMVCFSDSFSIVVEPYRVNSMALMTVLKSVGCLPSILFGKAWARSLPFPSLTNCSQLLYCSSLNPAVYSSFFFIYPNS